MSENQKEQDANYMEKVAVQDGDGIIDYDPEKMKDIVGGEKLTYDEYLEIQRKHGREVRGSFQLCYYENALGFRGQIERKTKDKVCFKRIFVEGMYYDGECFDGKEDHVWMDLKGFEQYQEGDCLSFWAEVYRYLKTGNGKMIDFGLRNPAQIQKIDKYELPTDEELLKQEIGFMVCETCYLHEQCFGTCLLPKGKKKTMINSLYKDVRNLGKE